MIVAAHCALSQMSPHAVLLMLLTRKGAPVKRMYPEMTQS